MPSPTPAAWGGITGDIAQQQDLSGALANLSTQSNTALAAAATAQESADAALNRASGGVVDGAVDFAGGATVGGQEIINAVQAQTLSNKTLASARFNGISLSNGTVSTASTTVSSAAPFQVIVVLTSTITLPAPSNGRIMKFKVAVAGTPNITIQTGSTSVNIDGSQTPIKITNSMGAVELGSTSSNWFVLSRF